MRVIAGRDFLPTDTEEAPPVALINETMARFHYGADDPLGYFMTVRGVEREIVGVVADVRQYGVLRGAEPGLYQPLRQENQDWAMRSQAVVIRTGGDPVAVAGAARQAVLGVDPTIAINDIRTMKSWVAEGVAEPRFRTTLLSLFAGVALLLSALGISGVMAYMVSRRVREFAVRMALGAQQPQVVRLVMGQGLRLTAVGLGVGMLGAVVLSQAMSSFLYGVVPLDLPVFLGASVALGSVAILALLYPALRAVRVDPAIALRGD
jgi:ABC-type antimicrobial peptide transport system permease subunit